MTFCAPPLISFTVSGTKLSSLSSYFERSTDDAPVPRVSTTRVPAFLFTVTVSRAPPAAAEPMASPGCFCFWLFSAFSAACARSLFFFCCAFACSAFLRRSSKRSPAERAGLTCPPPVTVFCGFFASAGFSCFAGAAGCAAAAGFAGSASGAFAAGAAGTLSCFGAGFSAGAGFSSAEGFLAAGFVEGIYVTPSI
ncbi:unknown [Anaerotruncus sp. CAG:390]|nr:unknown [Anaerotruncus sp. CAG:390]